MPETTKHIKTRASDPAGPSSGAEEAENAPSSWLQVGVIAAASALVGGLAAAWFYRKTLSRFREAEDDIPESRIIDDASPEDF